MKPLEHAVRISRIAPRPLVDPRWYVLAVEPNRDGRALRHLRRQGFTAWSFRVYVVHYTRKRVIDTIALMFPGYVFVQLEKATTRWPDVLKTEGVADVLRDQGYPYPVPQRVMAALLEHVDCTGLTNPQDVPRKAPRRKYEPDQLLRITEGSMEGLLARFVAPASGQDRIKVLMTMLGRETTVEIPEVQIEPIDGE